MSIYQLKQTQKVPATLDKVWDFISSPRNLKRITPDYMGFEIITDDLPEKMYPGMIIAYNVSPVLGIKMTWVTEITHVEDHSFFVDEQRVGPYDVWHHEHKLEEIDGGVLMTDIVTYKPPFGLLGQAANGIFIRKQIEEIFAYRDKAVIDIFGEFKEK
ncbi:MAG: SRPBCC family protein [Chitinophagales bacterium]